MAADGKTSSNPGPSDITTPSKQTEITGIVPMKTVGVCYLFRTGDINIHIFSHVLSKSISICL